MKDIIIAGAGHLGLDIYNLLEEINSVKRLWNIKGFINDIPVDLDRFKLPIKILGTINDWQPSDNEVFAMAIGSPSGRKMVAEKLIRRGAVFETLISPYAQVSKTAKIGNGSVIFRDCLIAPCTTLGQFTCIGHSTSIGLDASVGEYSNTALRVNIYQDVKVGCACQIWSSSVILNSVGDNSIVGAGSVVISKVKPCTRVLGNPAQEFGRTDEGV